MSGSVNKCILLGNVCNDPEIRTFSNGGKVANFSLATNQTWRDKTSGEKKQKSEFHRIAIMSDGLVNVVEKYVSKGSKLYLEGKLQTRKWTDRDGNEKFTTEVVIQGFGGSLVMLDGKSNASNNSQSNYSNRGSNTPASQTSADNFDLENEIPF